ncbi:glycoside hydrolase family 32 protein [Paenibacillus humicola]|uniref:glycoside hydrolase family 32 protein n=1 Tax=Paenibacillus humicola TaxID=3110540 RepID=UPI00237A24B6|nr:glycoside hydrolase family 32 protein [Paenibacillus humicola]
MTDLLRPRYHLMPEKNWMNDPNGAIYYNGEYHLFYQHNPHAAEWGDIHWGHAKSKDLVRWDHLPHALSPSAESGELHCYSGCAVLDGHVPKIFYTSVGSGARNAADGAEQWMAFSTDGMTTWEKAKTNPVLTAASHSPLDIREWRDPFVWKEDGLWYMVVGGSHEGKGCVLVHRSPDLAGWTYWTMLFRGDDPIFECPNFFRLGSKWVLIASPGDRVKHWAGEWNEDGTFTPEQEGIVDFGGWDGYYAPLTFLCPAGRRLMWGWLPEASRGSFAGITDWAGVMSLPRELILAEDGTLRFAPAEETKSLRALQLTPAGWTLESGLWRTGIRGRALEIAVSFRPSEACGRFGLKLLHSPSFEEESVLVFDCQNNRFSLDRAKSSLAEEPRRSAIEGDFVYAPGEDLQVRLFVDHSLVEVFVNESHCLTGRIYPLRADSDGVSVFAEQPGRVEISDFQAWELSME